jgi:hypothetical protein
MEHRLCDDKQEASVFECLVGDCTSFEEHLGLIRRGGLKVRPRYIDGCYEGFVPPSRVFLTEHRLCDDKQQASVFGCLVGDCISFEKDL